MYARLWWKDARQFWPIWVLLVSGAAVIQWLMLTFVGRPVQNGTLGVIALLWASLYALAAGAAAFAGERESGTLRLIDILSIDRRVVWAGKISFAVATTLALTVTLLLMAALSTERSKILILQTPGVQFSVVMFVLLALGWGLFWSSILKSALAAALAAMCCTGLMLSYFMGNLNPSLAASSASASFRFGQVAVVVATIAASHVFFTRSLRLRRSPVQFRSPIVFTGSRRPRSERIQGQSPGTVLAAPFSAEIAVMRHLQIPAQARVGRRSWLLETRNLIWQTIKEGSKTWSMLLAIAVALPAAFYRFGGDTVDPIYFPIIGLLVVVAAGASVFGLENRARTQRVLVHHGARPGSVWLVKFTTWLIGLVVLTIIFSALMILCLMMGQSLGRGGGDWSLIVPCMPLAYAVALNCGMALRRGITAFVIAVMLASCLAWTLVALVFANLLSAPGIVVVAAALVAVSWAWRTDWMLERPAPGRWLRLGLFTAAAFALLFVWYIGFRAWSVPDVGPIAPPEAWARGSSIATSPDRNAADIYREAGRLLRYRQDDVEFLNQNKHGLEVIHQAAARPDCRFDRPDRPTLVDRDIRPSSLPFVRLASLDARDRLSHGDLARAWDDIIVLFRMARHFAEGAGVDEATLAVRYFEREALGVAFEWALAPGQTSEQLHAALEAYRNLPKLPAPSEVVRAEANLVENTLNLPTSKLRGYLEESLYGTPPHTDNVDRTIQYGMINLVTTPWELTHARRVNRFVSAAALESAAREPGHRQEHYWNSGASSLANSMLPEPLQRLSRSLNEYLMADEQNEVGRRALVQTFAIRAWQLKHDGRFPKALDALVPEELPSLPIDPYSDRPFGFVPSNGATVVPLRWALSTVQIPRDVKCSPPPPGSWLLYSVGPDRRDNGGIALTDDLILRVFEQYDIVFAIPPLPGTPPAAKVESQRAPKPTSEPPKPR
jgi:ABC-type transport system involved in multi-copper enzyme maturation permease subunit